MKIKIVKVKLEQPYRLYRYTFEMKLDRYQVHPNEQNLNFMAQELMTTVMKLKNDLSKKFNALILSEGNYKRNYWRAYFKEEQDATNAKEYIDSIILHVAMAGKENIAKQRAENNAIKKANKEEKAIQLLFKKISYFKNKPGKMHVNVSYMTDPLIYDSELLDVQRDDKYFILKFQHGELKLLHSNLNASYIFIQLSQNIFFHIEKVG